MLTFDILVFNVCADETLAERGWKQWVSCYYYGPLRFQSKHADARPFSAESHLMSAASTVWTPEFLSFSLLTWRRALLTKVDLYLYHDTTRQRDRSFLSNLYHLGK